MFSLCVKLKGVYPEIDRYRKIYVDMYVCI